MWNDIDWNKIQHYVRRIQYRIFRAQQNENTKLVHWLQKHLIDTKSAKIMAVHQVTTLNKGRKTMGVDKQLVLTSQEKAKLAETLDLNGKANPVTKVQIPNSGKTQKRPLGTIRDRAKQALTKLALEPEWEAKFEPNSYGFRPGRRPHDAIEAIFTCLHYNKPKHIYNADIKKCFDKIDHEALIKKLQTFPRMRKQIKAWLEARVMKNLSGEDDQPTVNGPPVLRRGVISPLLANIALHGLENHLKEHVANLKSPFQGGHRKRNKQRALGVIRYADDFVLIQSDKSILDSCINETQKWLENVGLETSETKSVLRDGREGFNFLGFQIIQTRKLKAERFKVKITPSKKARVNLLEKVKQVIQHKKAASSYQLIKILSPIILGWANYYKYCECSDVFRKLDHAIFLKLRAWVFRRHPKNSRYVVKEKYFPAEKTYLFDGREHYDNWVLVGEEKGRRGENLKNFLSKMSWIHSSKFEKVKGSKSPFDNDQLYWTLKTGKYSSYST